MSEQIEQIASEQAQEITIKIAQLRSMQDQIIGSKTNTFGSIADLLLLLEKDRNGLRTQLTSLVNAAACFYGDCDEGCYYKSGDVLKSELDRAKSILNK